MVRQALTQLILRRDAWLLGGLHNKRTKERAMHGGCCQPLGEILEFRPGRLFPTVRNPERPAPVPRWPGKAHGSDLLRRIYIHSRLAYYGNALPVTKAGPYKRYGRSLSCLRR